MIKHYRFTILGKVVMGYIHVESKGSRKNLQFDIYIMDEVK